VVKSAVKEDTELELITVKMERQMEKELTDKIGHMLENVQITKNSWWKLENKEYRSCRSCKKKKKQHAKVAGMTDASARGHKYSNVHDVGIASRPEVWRRSESGSWKYSEAVSTKQVHGRYPSGEGHAFQGQGNDNFRRSQSMKV